MGFIDDKIGLDNIWSAVNLYENRRSARNQMRFQENMSSSAHSREVADLAKAGLNPILSAKYGGSSSPHGAGYSADSAVNSALSARRLSQEIKNMEATEKLTKAQAEKVRAETPKPKAIGSVWEEAIPLIDQAKVKWREMRRNSKERMDALKDSLNKSLKRSPFSAKDNIRLFGTDLFQQKGKKY